MTGPMRGRTRRGQAAFSLIEVVITIAILMTLTIAVAAMLRGGFDVRAGISQRAKVVHRLSVAITRVANDVEQTFFVSTKDQVKNGIGRRTKGIFKIDKQSAGDKLALTTKTHQPMKAGVHESDLTYVVYELREARDAPGRKDLYRGESKVLPEDFKEEPPMRLLAKNIKTFTVEAWNGERWLKNDYWDTGRGDTRNRLPKLVKIVIEAWSEDRLEGDPVDEAIESATDQIQTVVYLSDSWEYPEIKEGPKTINWSQL